MNRAACFHSKTICGQLPSLEAPHFSSPTDKESQDIGQNLFCLVMEFLGARAGQRVRNEEERITRRTVGICDGLAIGDETIGADWGGWNASSLQKDPVQHTAG